MANRIGTLVLRGPARQPGSRPRTRMTASQRSAGAVGVAPDGWLAMAATGPAGTGQAPAGRGPTRQARTGSKPTGRPAVVSDGASRPGTNGRRARSRASGTDGE